MVQYLRTWYLKVFLCLNLYLFENEKIGEKIATRKGGGRMLQIFRVNLSM